jgi:hypothetical protein
MSVAAGVDTPAAVDLAQTLAGAVGLARAPHVATIAGAPAVRWARSGLALLTGHPGAPPTLPDRDIAGRLQTLIDTVPAFAALNGAAIDLDISLFSARAAEMGLNRGGRVSANGTARLIETADGWLAANLARPDDRDAVPAWIGCGLADEPWAALARAAIGRTAAELADAAQALGIPTAVVGSRGDAQWLSREPGPIVGPRLVRMAASATPVTRRRPFVVDLSALWAGPLCGHLLTLAGARVVKVESARRPDGARLGPAGFYDSLHVGQESVALDFTTTEGRAQLARLIARADVVIEGTRPRALEQLGIDLDAAFRANPALVWVSVTAFGRTGPWRNHVGFGDDAAAAGGLIVWDADGAPVFLGDAIADPIAGLMAAGGAFAALAAGGGFLVDAALREAAAYVADAPLIGPSERGRVVGQEGDWRLRLDAVETPLRAPTYRAQSGSAPPMGRHTTAVLAEIA